jgi:hypothetical protein
MSTLQTEKAVRAWHQAGTICVQLSSGRTLAFPVSQNSRLAGATHRELNQIEISPFGLHWPALDEDLSTDGLIAGRFGNLHGGSRRGAGRKPVNHVRMQLSVKPEVRARIEKFAKTNAFTLSEAVEKMVETCGVKAVRVKGTKCRDFGVTKALGRKLMRKNTGLGSEKKDATK